jgi:hypothetical protein
MTMDIFRFQLRSTSVNIHLLLSWQRILSVNLSFIYVHLLATYPYCCHDNGYFPFSVTFSNLHLLLSWQQIRSVKKFSFALPCFQSILTLFKNFRGRGVLRISDIHMASTTLNKTNFGWFDFWCLTPLSTTFQLYHGDQF